jgi:hypothetical protein
MTDLTAKKRAKMPAKDFAKGGPKGAKGFPMNDPEHQRLAIGGATRSYEAGNISKAKEEEVQAEARKKLAKGPHQHMHGANQQLPHKRHD